MNRLWVVLLNFYTLAIRSHLKCRKPQSKANFDHQTNLACRILESKRSELLTLVVLSTWETKVSLDFFFPSKKRVGNVNRFFVLLLQFYKIAVRNNRNCRSLSAQHISIIQNIVTVNLAIADRSEGLLFFSLFSYFSHFFVFFLSFFHFFFHFFIFFHFSIFFRCFGCACTLLI